AHQPVQLLIGDVGDLLLYVFAFHVVSFLPALLFTRVASALAVQFYAMPGMFWGINGDKKCPLAPHAGQAGMKKPRCRICIVVSTNCWRGHYGTISTPGKTSM
ncbi:MAG: hypothetical protein SPJ32_05755, partial [Oscillospiraceae bacterium]|nr:hypothetical protein [Oscillospiraceae bacterium]